MPEHVFRLVLRVKASNLGNVLAELQLADTIIDECNVIAASAAPPAAPPSKITRPSRRNLKSPIQSGVSQRTRELLEGYLHGDTVVATEIAHALVDEGFKPNSSSSVVAMGLGGKRFEMIQPGRYKVVDRDQPITLYRRKAKVTHG